MCSNSGPRILRPFFSLLQLLLLAIPCVCSREHLEHVARIQELEAKWGGDYNYGGIATFAHLRHHECLVDKSHKFDIGILGIPVDDVRSWRGGSRFGPQAIREASSRQSSFRGFNHRASVNPYRSWARIIDCGDISIAPFGHGRALKVLDDSIWELNHRQAATNKKVHKPKLITIGGDLSTARWALHALSDLYQERIAIVSFGASCHAKHYAGFINPNSSIQIGCHAVEGVDGGCTTAGEETLSLFDLQQIFCDDIDEIGSDGISSLINNLVGTIVPVYLSVNLNILDAGQAPGVSEPSVGGWTARELIVLLRGIERVNVVGAEVIGVAPAYDNDGEQTALVAAQVVYEILTSMVKQGINSAKAKKPQ